MTAGLITTSDGYSYQLTPDDLLWAARMVYGESQTDLADGAAVLWAMAQHHAMIRGSSFTRTIKSYSQPINDAWYAGGSHCVPGGSGYGTPGCAQSALDRRAMIATLSASDIPDQYALVQRWAAGQVPNPVPKATDFADARVTQSCLAGSHGDCVALVKRISNWFVTSTRSSTWPANYVRVGGAGDASSWMQDAVVGLGVAVAAGLIAWVVAEELRP